jgi:hypothetical protein
MQFCEVRSVLSLKMMEIHFRHGNDLKIGLIGEQFEIGFVILQQR